ncbi:MAG: hypothetical protein LQ350_000788 [Teloschistes chrysophthalmus]|nr:MAG: hypothetical protein LQ350_000788 [Niorma chrysophthalma]
MKFTLSTLVSLTSLATAHFTLDYPPARGFDEDQLGTFPCGGQNTISSNRTTWPLAGGPIQLTMEHDHAAVQVLIALGNNPTDNFNAVLVPTTQEQGIGKFCLSDVKVPESLGVKDGDNATIQVVTNGDPTGGLYNCADITFSTTNSSSQECTNGKGVSMVKYTGKSANANGTDSATPSTSSSGTTTSASAGGSSPSPTTAKSSAGKLEFGGMALLAVVVGWMGVSSML